MKRFETLSIFLLVFIVLLSSSSAQLLLEPKTIPEELPKVLTHKLNQKRNTLNNRRLTLESQLERHEMRCSRVSSNDTDLINFCRTSMMKLDVGINAYYKDLAQFEQLKQATSKYQREKLEDQIRVLKSQIRRDQQAIRNLGLEKRSEDFEAWERLAEEAKEEFEIVTLDALITGALTGAKATVKTIGSLNQLEADKWISKLKSIGVSDPYL